MDGWMGERRLGKWRYESCKIDGWCVKVVSPPFPLPAEIIPFLRIDGKSWTSLDPTRCPLQDGMSHFLRDDLLPKISPE